MKKYIFSVVISIITMVATAQTEYDALRFSQTFVQGTARSAAMGGAFGALGGDISVTAINPAGMSIYRGFDVCITPLVLNNTVKSSFNGSSLEDSKFSMKFASLGIIMGNDRGKTTGITNFAWGITYNRLNDFSSNEMLEAVNNSSSMLDAWTTWSQSEDWSDYTNELAFKGGMIKFNEDAGRYINPHNVLWNSDYSGTYGQTQNRTVTQKGGINSWDFAVSGAYNDMFFLGASLGVQSVNYKYTSHYHEYDKQNVVEYDYWDFNEKNKVNGGGVNLKVGILIKPINFLRFGAAFHTPTVYSLTDKYSTSFKRVFDVNIQDNSESNEFQPPTGNISEYELSTPMKGVLSAAFIVPGYGLVSFDYESVNYSKCKFQGKDFDDDDSWMTTANNASKRKFQKTNNFRVGVEGLAGPVSIRAGYALYGNPYKFVSGNKQRQIASFGLGFRPTEDVYVDLTGTYHIYQTDSYIYESEDVWQVFHYDNRYLNVLLTVGVRM